MTQYDWFFKFVPKFMMKDDNGVGLPAILFASFVWCLLVVIASNIVAVGLLLLGPL